MVFLLKYSLYEKTSLKNFITSLSPVLLPSKMDLYTIRGHCQAFCQHLQRYENGTNLLNTDKLQLIANFLDIPVGYFFEEHPKMAVAEETGKFIPSKEAGFLRLFRRLDEKYRKAILLFMELAADVRKG